MAEWSEWMTETQPEVGMYVQVRARHRGCPSGRRWN